MASVRTLIAMFLTIIKRQFLEALEDDDDLERDLCDTANKGSISYLNYMIREWKTGPHIRETQAYLAS